MSSYDLRRYEEADWPAVLDLMRLSLGWRDGDPNETFFRWKHRDNVFGPSPAWVAVGDGRIIGFRTFMRWEFAHGGHVVRAVRAVDTATHPEHQGRGVFKRLTLHSIDALREDGVAFIFNTPNDASRPGYLKMGWQVVGRLPVGVRPRSVAALPVIARARGPADLWSTPTSAGHDASEILSGPDVADLLRAMAPMRGMSTHQTPEYLRWRYGLPALHYRAMTLGQSVRDGLVVFRVRRRVAATEAAVCEVLMPARTRGQSAIARLVSGSSADYAIALRPAPGLVPLPRQGPLLTCFPLQGQTLPDWRNTRLSLGDIELF